MPACIQCLLCEHEDLSVDFNTHIKKTNKKNGTWWSMLVTTVLVRWRQDDFWCLLLRQIGLMVESQTSEKCCLYPVKQNSTLLSGPYMYANTKH